MSPETTRLALPYPTADDSADVPRDIQALAERLDDAIPIPTPDPRGYAEVLAESTRGGAAGDPSTSPGPAVTVDVPANALVLVKFEVELKLAAGTGEGLVWLAEDGVAASVRSTYNASTSYVRAYSTDAATAGSADRINSGALVFPAAAGSHTYKLLYGTSGMSVAAFRNRRLWVTVLPF